MICVQHSQDFFSSVFPAVALKSFHVHARGVSFAQARGELHLAMDGIIVPDESADETDDDDGRLRAFLCRDDRIVAGSMYIPVSLGHNFVAKRNHGHERKETSANRVTNSTDRNRVHQLSDPGKQYHYSS